MTLRTAKADKLGLVFSNSLTRRRYAHAQIDTKPMANGKSELTNVMRHLPKRVEIYRYLRRWLKNGNGNAVSRLSFSQTAIDPSCV